MKKWIVLGVVFGLFCSRFAAADSHALIIGGERVTDPRVLRATVGIERGRLFCSGSYIGDGKVVTAAHCADPDGDMKVKFVLPNFGVETCYVAKTILNPKFVDVTSTTAEDIAVLKIWCRDFDLSTAPAFKLAGPETVFQRTEVDQAGYGLAERSWFPTFPKLYQIRPTQEFPLEKLADMVELSKAIRANQVICYRGSNEASFFEGDSGGPTYVFDAENEPVLVGVHSINLIYNSDQAIAGGCDALTARFRDWILAQ